MTGTKACIVIDASILDGRLKNEFSAYYIIGRESAKNSVDGAENEGLE